VRDPDPLTRPIERKPSRSPWCIRLGRQPAVILQSFFGFGCFLGYWCVGGERLPALLCQFLLGFVQQITSWVPRYRKPTNNTSNTLVLLVKMGRGFSEEEVNELKEQFDLFDMMGDGEFV
jgi:hypothetical protein